MGMNRKGAIKRKKSRGDCYEEITKELGVLRGWKEIRDACGLTCSIQTMRRMARKYYIPIYYIENRPTALKFMIQRWWVIFTKKALEFEEREKRNTL